MTTTAFKEALQHKIDTKTKPLGALGVLEQIAFKIGNIQQTLTPKLTRPTIVVFAGDHGIAKKNEVNPFPQEVTAQMVYNFVNGGAAINVFSKTNGIDLKIVDAGVNHSFDKNLDIINAKIALGTKNFENAPAMSLTECQDATIKAGNIIEHIHSKGCNTIGFGELGIANTSSLLY
jgi:nicotinate-nucleotide--dimethylbenzimidazole phosphoribosyltransferase